MYRDCDRDSDRDCDRDHKRDPCPHDRSRLSLDFWATLQKGIQARCAGLQTDNILALLCFALEGSSRDR
jgi:hypothetical protein